MFFLKYLLLALFRPKSRLFLEYRLFKMLNKERKAEGLWTLFFQNDLRAVARKHSSDMARQNYFAHEAKDGSSPKDRFERSRVSEAIAGENLAKVRGYKHPVKASHVGLMNSPGHKANILSKAYNCVGIGLAISVDRTYYFTQNFSYRYLVLKEFSEKIWFANSLNIKGEVIKDNVTRVVLVSKNDFYDLEEKLIFDPKKDKHFRFKISLAKASTYEVQVFVLLQGEKQYKLSNAFSVKKGFLS